MKFDPPLEKYNAKVREVTWGPDGGAVTIGGENTLPFHYFEGQIPNLPALALEVLDHEPDNWAPAIFEPYREVISDPPAWAKKCVDDYGAKVVFLRLAATDPMAGDVSPDDAAALTERVAEAAGVPLIVWGTGDDKKDAAVLTAVAARCSGRKLLLGPVLKQNYEAIAAAAKEHGHAIVPQASMDVNLTKELNIALCRSFPPDRIAVDPTSSALGYGLEFTFSIIERIKQIGLVDRDNMLQMPVFTDVGIDSWRAKEAKEHEVQGILWEAVTAMSFILAGADLVVMRHPEAMRLVRETITECD